MQVAILDAILGHLGGRTDGLSRKNNHDGTTVTRRARRFYFCDIDRHERLTATAHDEQRRLLSSGD
jgi:hypothetical protein